VNSRKKPFTGKPTDNMLGPMKIVSNYKHQTIPLPEGKPNIVWRQSRGLMCATVGGKDLPITGCGSDEMGEMLREIEDTYGSDARHKFESIIDEEL